jgi:predicted membrane protein
LLNSVQFATANYGQSERKIRIEVTTLIGDIQVIQAGSLG